MPKGLMMSNPGSPGSLSASRTGPTADPTPVPTPLPAPLGVPEVIRTRRAIRHYAPDPVPDHLLRDLLDLTLRAPSAWNGQARSVVAVTDPAGLAGLVRATGGQSQPREAPVMLVFVADCADRPTDREDIHRAAREAGAWSAASAEDFLASERAHRRGLAARGLLREYAVKDAMLAAAHALLAATALGLATCPMNGWDETAVKEVIGVADRDDLAIALLTPVGFPAETRRPPGRLPLGRRAFADRYGVPFGAPPTGTPGSAVRT
ncbi:nitroreductase family protein [Streptomyces sp. ST2-7A]|uniref:nitroreductase family protein n=1 Tax=Streptomyces sp. ST2-7A TaxID=2907214 RepID=UPI001F1B5295|nr:nitroreductase family protein [Streptomyces sp. ST2-7A]MCE7083032.1 nitroreductase family protein [Streptomyces sp. ST2-7A]